ncbi:hypothetical protein L665_01479 [Ralstonia solanacearum SD54]|nr:hypothetical protein L665_01479 [Ralstonia solanacearum SD54]
MFLFFLIAAGRRKTRFACIWADFVDVGDSNIQTCMRFE